MSTPAIADFWKWWVTANQAFARTFTERLPLENDLIEALSAKVAAIEPSLDWEFGAGVESEHQLCLSGKGDPVMRLVAERWLASAPPGDATWEYHASRQPSEAVDMTLTIGGHEVSFGLITFAVARDASRELLDLEGWHPAFSRIEEAELRMRILFLSLDQLLGEDGVERWIGSIEAATEPPEEAISFGELRDAVASLKGEATQQQWAVLRGERDGKPVFVTTNLALKRIDHLLLDMHLTVALPLREPTEAGLTSDAEAGLLNALEDELTAALGEHGALLGRETTDGRRVIHYRVMEGGPASSIVYRWARAHGDRAPDVQVAMDPRWERRAW